MIDLKRGLAVAEEAPSWCGTPFRWQQSTKGVGADCKGLVRGVAAELGFPEANNLYAAMTDYRGDRRLQPGLLKQGLADVFDPVPFDIGAVDRWLWAGLADPARSLLPDCFAPGAVLLGRVRAPVHLGIFTGPGLHPGDGRVIHAQIEPNDRVKDASLKAWLKTYRLDSVWQWRELTGAEA